MNENAKNVVPMRDPLSLLRADLDPAYLDSNTQDFSENLASSEKSKDAKNENSYLIFRLANKLFAFLSHDVEKISPYNAGSEMPFIHNQYTLGFANVDGNVAPLVDVIAALRIDELEMAAGFKRIIFFRHQGFLSGVPVESVEGVCRAVPRTTGEGLSSISESVVSSPSGSAVVLAVSKLTHLVTEEMI